MAENCVWGLSDFPVPHSPKVVVCNHWAFSRQRLRTTKSVPTSTAVIKTNDLFLPANQNVLSSTGKPSQHLLFWRVKVFWASLKEPEDFIALWNMGRKPNQCLQNKTEWEALRHEPSLKHGFKHLNYQAWGGKTVLAEGKEYSRTASNLATYLRRKETASFDCKCQVGSNEFRQATVLRISQCNLFCPLFKNRIYPQVQNHDTA